MKSNRDVIGRIFSLLLSLDVPDVDVLTVLAAWFPRGHCHTLTRHGKAVTLVGTGESRDTRDSRLWAFIERLETIHRQRQACRPPKTRKLDEHTYGPIAPHPEDYNVELVVHLRHGFSEYQRLATIASTLKNAATMAAAAASVASGVAAAAVSLNAATMAATAASFASEVESTVSKRMAADTPVTMDATFSQFTLWKTEPTPLGVSIAILSSYIVISKVRTSTVFTRRLAVGDKIIRIQGTPVTQLSEDQMVSMLASRPLELRFSRCKP